jgi:hypothetical protein
MDNTRKKSAAGNHSSASDAERRRIGRIVADERGNKTLSWYDAPADYKRDVLEIEGEPGVLTIKKAAPTFDPYARGELPQAKKAAAPKKDLKKLSEWIKLMRDMEERKKKGEV